MRLEIQLTLDEKQKLLSGMKIKGGRFLSSHVRECALKQNTEYIANIRYQFNDKPAPLSERMPWGNKPVVATKEDLITDERSTN